MGAIMASDVSQPGTIKMPTQHIPTHIQLDCSITDSAMACASLPHEQPVMWKVHDRTVFQDDRLNWLEECRRHRLLGSQVMGRTLFQHVPEKLGSLRRHALAQPRCAQISFPTPQDLAAPLQGQVWLLQQAEDPTLRTIGPIEGADSFDEACFQGQVLCPPVQDLRQRPADFCSTAPLWLLLHQVFDIPSRCFKEPFVVYLLHFMRMGWRYRHSLIRPFRRSYHSGTIFVE
jgi:hypothetical protein